MILKRSMDLTDHMVPHMRELPLSAMKVIGKFVPDFPTLPMSGGLPHGSLFPMRHATFTIPETSSLNGDLTDWIRGVCPTRTVHLNNEGPGDEGLPSGALDLKQVFQYGVTNGFPELIKALEELVFRLHGKPYEDMKVHLSIGSNDIISKCMRMFIEPGLDGVLCDRFCYGTACHLMRSWGAKLHPIDSDSNGLVVEAFARTLRDWNVELQGRKPRLLYLIPVGNNPTGTMMPEDRYQDIYSLCQEHDIIILEDDPYYHLQFSEYDPDIARREAKLASIRKTLPPAPAHGRDDDVDAVLKAFDSTGSARSFLSRDIDGRVMRIDSVSKCFGPGLRLGWITCNSRFYDTFIKIAQISTQVTNNMSQAVMASYLSEENWGIGGFLRWLLEYQRKRDLFLDCFYRYCPTNFISTEPCGGAMYQWMTVKVDEHPRFERDFRRSEDATGSVGALTNTRELMDEFYQKLIHEGRLLTMPGFLFVVARQGVDETADANHLRFAGDNATLEEGAKALGETVTNWFQS